MPLPEATCSPSWLLYAQALQFVATSVVLLFLISSILFTVWTTVNVGQKMNWRKGIVAQTSDFWLEED